MADMADLDQVEEAWTIIAGITDIERVVPIWIASESASSPPFDERIRSIV